MVLSLLLLFLAYYLGSVVISNLEKDILKDSAINGSERVRYYKRTLAWRTLPVLFIVLAVAMTPMSLTDMGIRGVHTGFIAGNKEISAAVMAACAVCAGGLICKCLFGKQNKRQALIETEKTNSRASVKFDLTVPESLREKRWFAAFSLISAAEKELIFRGFLFYLMAGVFPALPLLLLPVVTAVFMGLCNFCLGPKEMVRILLVNALLGFLYIVCGSLLPCFVMHFVITFFSGCTYAGPERCGSVIN